MLREANFVESVTEVAVTVTLADGTVAGAEKSVAIPLGTFVELNVPHAFALPQVTDQITPELAGSLATNAVNPAPVEVCIAAGLGPMVTAIAGAGLFVRLKVAVPDTPAVDAVTV